MATLNVRWYQRVQGFLFFVTGFSSLYLFTVLGSSKFGEGEVYMIGFLGFICIFLVLAIDNIVLNRAHKNHKRQQQLEIIKARSVRAISAGEIEGGMLMATFI
ncbi:hypothetical protein TrLO_g12674 [Triparma laevis f. longispina]|uniref:Uncharacterized protein n=1 Tax=Triparma laevis f. longispina TaxID=1714387 RepID=A0A9W7A8L8_9STRA|nr:hypothetical protein TrLO_g12674 [Triparma laevis f. longispina]